MARHGVTPRSPSAATRACRSSRRAVTTSLPAKMRAMAPPFPPPLSEARPVLPVPNGLAPARAPEGGRLSAQLLRHQGKHRVGLGAAGIQQHGRLVSIAAARSASAIEPTLMITFRLAACRAALANAAAAPASERPACCRGEP